ncbi:MAG: FliO/MopB family protein [Alphaproteobacteria bacterium]
MDVISPELPQIVRLLIALAFVVGLMGGLAFVLKKLGLATPQSIKTTDKRRLKIVESLPLDARRRLMIIQCDGREHLIIAGNNNETIVQTDIGTVDDSKVSDQSA